MGVQSLKVDTEVVASRILTRKYCRVFIREQEGATKATGESYLAGYRGVGTDGVNVMRVQQHICGHETFPELTTKAEDKKWCLT